MGLVNEAEFQPPLEAENLRAAMGYRGSSDQRIGGIFNPGKSKLPKDQVIYRLGNRARTLQDDRNGPWWMLESTLKLNADTALDVEALVVNLRQRLAVPPNFSPMDRVFRAVVTQRIYAYAGVGTGVWQYPDPAHSQPGDRQIIYTAGTERDGSSRDTSLCYQLFLPHLAGYSRAALAYHPVMTLRAWFGIRRFV